MNKRELTAELGARMENRGHVLTGVAVRDFLEVFEEVVTEAVVSGDPVMLSGFCKFARVDVSAKPKRKGRNPATGEEMMFAAKPASKKVRITPLKKLKDAVVAAKPKKAGVKRR